MRKPLFFLFCALLPLFLGAVQTPEDARRLGFVTALFQSSEKRLHPLEGIPRTLHFIWLGPKPFPAESVSYVKEWLDCHPHWAVKFWTDMERAPPDRRMQVHLLGDFPLKELQDVYYLSDNFGERSELLRYALLLEEGGVYVDHDVECLASLDTLAKGHDFFCGLEPIQPTILSSNINPSTHLIGSAAHHPILQAAKAWLLNEWSRLERDYPEIGFNRVKHRTYRALGVGFWQAHSRQGRKDVIFPPEYFSETTRELGRFALHHCLGAWHRPQTEAEAKIQKLISSLTGETQQTYYLAMLLTILNVAGVGWFLREYFRHRKVSS
ncbi:MAG: hypothetical protein JSS61_03665 [Verrucomicrobia bacterium]|nr:hypothetical protein [Verrucomicrobiota bacterium]